MHDLLLLKKEKNFLFKFVLETEIIVKHVWNDRCFWSTYDNDTFIYIYIYKWRKSNSGLVKIDEIFYVNI